MMKIQSIGYICDIIHNVLNNLKVIDFYHEKTEQAFKYFEVLNDRGLYVDLLKNYF